LAVHVSQAFDHFHVFAKDPQAIQSTYRVFEEDLAGFSAEKIDAAFKEYRRENKVMPTVADILKILNWDPLPKSAESRQFDRKAAAVQEKAERYQNLTLAQQEKHDELMEQIRAAGKPESKLTKGPGKLDYKHWERMSPEAKEAAKIKSPRQAGA